MTMTLSGSGSIGGLVAGGLPDASVVAADLASGAARTNFGAGAVLQVVSATYSTQVSTTSAAFVTTGIAASITPTSSSNKILVSINGVLSVHQLSAANFGLGVAIYRNASNVFADPNSFDSLYLAPYGNYIGVDRKRLSINYLDSPATTSSTTYTLYFAAYQGTAYSCANSAPATITLMEIAA